MRDGRFRDKAKRAWKVAELLHGLLKGKEKLPHREAVRHIRNAFGEEFLYKNRNGNLAISDHVLAIFEMFTQENLVWAMHGRYWRRRKPGDPSTGRMVSY